MSDDMKRLVAELERVLLERGGSLDAPARDDLNDRIDRLKRALDMATAAEALRMKAEVLNILAVLLSLVTNVTSLMK